MSLKDFLKKGINIKASHKEELSEKRFNTYRSKLKDINSNKINLLTKENKTNNKIKGNNEIKNKTVKVNDSPTKNLKNNNSKTIMSLLSNDPLLSIIGLKKTSSW